MLKKARADLSGKDAGDSKEMSQAVLDSSRHIWLAGLGAFSRAQAEGMKVFETLVKQGQVLESRTRRAAVDLLDDVLLSHLSYEERELIEPLARLGVM